MKIPANNSRMSIPSSIQIAISTLLSVGLGLPTAVLGGCCCGNAFGDDGGESATVKSPCCQAAPQADEARGCCLPDSQCVSSENCRSCQSRTTFLGEKLSHVPNSDSGETLSPTAVAEPRQQLAAHLAPLSPFDSHNARLSRISVWRK
jgi:hypothetical protein